MRSFLLIAALLAAACSDPVTAGSVQGTYDLASLNGQPLPYDPGLGCCIYLSGRLILTEDVFEISITSRNKNNQIVSAVTGSGTFAVAGTALTFQQSKGDIAFSLHNARVSGSTITLAFGGDGPGAADQFRAVLVR